MAYIKLQYKSMALLRGVTVDVILPSDGMGGVEIPTPYKTLYFLPGYSADSTELLQYLSLRSQSELKGIAIVIPNGENSFYIDRPDRNQNFSTFVGKELVEITRKYLPLSNKKEDTYIGGISMGGYGALLNGLRYHDTFSKVAVMSPCVDAYDLMMQDAPGFSLELFNQLFRSKEQYMAEDTNLSKAYTEAESRPRIFIGCGRQDILVYKQVKKFVAELTEKNVPVDYKEMEGNHDLDCWERMLDAEFSFLADIEEGTKNALVI